MTLTNPTRTAQMEPADHDLITWAYDPVGAVTVTAIPAAGTLNVVKLKLSRPTLVTAIVMLLGAPGATLTAGQNFAVLFDETGAQVGVTADQATAWAGATGGKDMPLVTPVVVNGPFCRVGFYSNGGTQPSFRLSAVVASAPNVNLATAASRFGTANTGLTTTPPATLGTITAAANPWWVGLR